MKDRTNLETVRRAGASTSNAAAPEEVGGGGHLGKASLWQRRDTIRRKHPTRFWLIAPLALYALAVPMPASLLVPREMRVVLFNTRPMLLLAAVAAATVAAALRGRLRSEALTSRLAICGMAFPVLFTFLGWLKGNMDVPVTAQYWMWAWVSFVLAPAIMKSEEDLRAVASVFFVMACLQWLVALGAFSLIEVPWSVSYFADRISFGFGNPNYYAQIPQVAVIAGGYSLYTEKGERGARRFAFVVIAAMVLAALARSRNVLAFLAVASGFLFLARRFRGWALSVAALLIVLVTVGLVALQTEREWSTAELDHRLSGRLSFWEEGLSWREGRSPLKDGLIGPEVVDVGSVARAYDDARDEKVFQKLHVDNFYLETVLEAGVLGLVAFIVPYGMLARRSVERMRNRRAAARGAWSTSVIIGVAVQGCFVATVPSFGSPLGVCLMLLAAAPLAHLDSVVRNSEDRVRRQDGAT